MLSLIGHWLRDWFLSWAGLSILVAVGAAVVWWFIPPIFIKVKALAFNVAIGALAFNFVYTMGFENGASSTRTQWKAAEQNAIDRGGTAREQAEQEIPPVVDAPMVEEQPQPQSCPAPGSTAPAPRPRARPTPVPRELRDDKFNRDNR